MPLILGGVGDDTKVDTQSSDIIRTLNGNDTISISGGEDFVDGGPGTDTVNFAGSAGDFTITRSGSSVLVSQDNFGQARLVNVETLVFGNNGGTPTTFPAQPVHHGVTGIEVCWCEAGAALVDDGLLVAMSEATAVLQRAEAFGVRGLRCAAPGARWSEFFTRRVI